MASTVGRPPVRRRSAGSDSGTHAQTAVSNNSPDTASATNTGRHEPTPRMWPPTTGATTGAVIPITLSVESWRAARVPVNRSLMTARPMTSPALPAIPCSSRATSNTAMDGASAQTRDDTVNMPEPARSRRRRPIASLTGPSTT
ncbi:hypothetical protein HOK021_34700 [Streptomyces hygroscopicus]|nr:hypothetical protein HOK021_34700 [Streptomyces hygroscopicus]